MKRLVLVAMMLGSAGLAGCQSDEDKGVYTAPKPLDKMSTAEWCAFYAKYITDPSLSPKTKQADIDRMRARGCPMNG